MVRVQKESQFSQIKTLMPSVSVDAVPVDSIPLIAQSAQIQNLKSKLIELQQQKVQLAERYGDKHPALQNAIAQLADTQRQLNLEVTKALQSVKNDFDTAVLEERTLSQNLEAAKADAQDLSRKSVGYNVMEREAKSNRQVYESLLQREKELRVSSNSRANNVRVVDRAEVPKSALAPTGRRTWLMSFAIGLVVAIGVAFGLDYMNDTIKTPEDVTRRLKLPFLGLVPSVRGDKHPVLASSHVPHDFGEAFRSLRTSLMSRFTGEGTKTLLVTSAQPLEGKTTTACNIAMALAYGGARVLLIDADMRRPGLHRPLQLTNERGLSQVLIGQARVRDVIQRTVDPNLLAITAGRTPPNPSELLASERMKTLLSNLSHGPFDWIVIDTPPVLAVTDAVDPRAARVGRHVRGRRGNDAAPARRARARYHHVGAPAVRRRGAEQGRFRAKQVLLFALLRPPVQELLRRSRGLIVPRAPARSPSFSASLFSRSPADTTGWRICWPGPPSSSRSSFARRWRAGQPLARCGSRGVRGIVAAATVPLPPAIRLALSPATRAIDLTFQLDGTPAAASEGVRALSIDPAATTVSLAAVDRAAAAVLVGARRLRARRRPALRPRHRRPGSGARRGRDRPACDGAASSATGRFQRNPPRRSGRS